MGKSRGPSSRASGSSGLILGMRRALGSALRFLVTVGRVYADPEAQFSV